MKQSEEARRDSPELEEVKDLRLVDIARIEQVVEVVYHCEAV